MIDVENLPQLPGIYMFKNRDGEILYIWKAKNVKKRVISHLNGKNIKDRHILREISTVDYIITRGEMEALLLEEKLIKEYHPPFNVSLKDDKSYPYLLLTTQDEYPGLFLIRGIKNRKGKLFGPYSNVKNLRKALKYIRFLFPVRNCWVFRQRFRPCMEYSLSRCLAPCTENVSKKEYMEVVSKLNDFLSGKTEKTFENLNKRMKEASEKLNFELAAYYRDVIKGIEGIRAGAEIKIQYKDLDLLETEKEGKAVYLLRIREGRVAGGEIFFFEGEIKSPFLTLERFIEDYYFKTNNVPSIIATDPFLPKKKEIEKDLKDTLGVKTRIINAGNSLKEVKAIALRNLTNKLIKRSLTMPADLSDKGIKELTDVLALNKSPLRIEGIDISHLAGEEKVGSLVVFLNGKPYRKLFRRYRIKDIEGIDDPKAVAQVVRRRLSRLKDKGEEMPDLVLIDGGIPQLSAALKERNKLGLSSPKIIALAKREEEVYIEKRKYPLRLSRSSPGLLLLMNIRDEAHRFAITYNRKLRERIKISYMEVDGIGPKRAGRLINEFSSLEEIERSTEDEISIRTGIPKNVARRLKTHLEKY